jgi:hypothetical protein
VALLWAAQVQLGQLHLAQLRARCDELLSNPLVLPAYPRYLSGFVHALELAPGLAGFVVEAISQAFTRLPDPVLLPWLPTLIITLKASAADLAPLLIREADRIFPSRLAALDEWVSPWLADESLPVAPRAARGRGVPLLAAHPAACDAVARLLDCEGTWETDVTPHGAVLVGHTHLNTGQSRHHTDIVPGPQIGRCLGDQFTSVSGAVLFQRCSTLASFQ